MGCGGFGFGFGFGFRTTVGWKRRERIDEVDDGDAEEMRDGVVNIVVDGDLSFASPPSTTPLLVTTEGMGCKVFLCLYSVL